MVAHGGWHMVWERKKEKNGQQHMVTWSDLKKSDLQDSCRLTHGGQEKILFFGRKKTLAILLIS